MRKIKTQKKIQILDKIILMIQLLASALFLYLFKKILPMKYWLILVVLLVLLNLVIYRKMRKYKRGQEPEKKTGVKDPASRKRGRVRIYSLLMSIVLIVCSLAAGKGLGALENIAGETKQTRLYTVVVNADSPYEKLADIEGKELGYVSGTEIEKILETIQSTEKITVTTLDQSSYIELGKSLLDEQIDAIILNESYRGLIEDEYSEFSTDTRIIYEYEEHETIQRTESAKKVSKESFNVFISGIDTYGKVATVSRSDVNMIVTVNPVTKQILMTSIPRDYYVELASYGVKDKLTHAGIYGVEESMETLERVFDIEFDYYAKVNFTSLVTIVDALGGITVYNDQAFNSYRYNDYYPVGEIYMDGDKALEFVRERYALANGDNDRVKNQQKVLKAMIDKAISPAIITNFSSILNAVSGSVATSMDSKNIQELIQMQLNDMASWDIQQISVTGTGTTTTSCYSMPGSRVYVMEPDYSSVEAATAKINEIFNAK